MDTKADLRVDLCEMLKSVLHHWGPDGAHKVCNDVMEAREHREMSKLTKSDKVLLAKAIRIAVEDTSIYSGTDETDEDIRSIDSQLDAIRQKLDLPG